MAGRATKIHLVVDAHGNPINFLLSDSTIHDVKVAPDLAVATRFEKLKQSYGNTVHSLVLISG